MLDLSTGSKPLALNAADAAARHPVHTYLDGDVIVTPGLMAALAVALAGPAPRYATGTAVIPRSALAFTRAYARFWQKLPFARSPAPGYGLFSVNAAGRARWAEFPNIISDDTFTRLQFTPEERLQVPQTYLWPMIEGFARLTRVRVRQDAGVYELARLFPDIVGREAPLHPAPPSHPRHHRSLGLRRLRRRRPAHPPDPPFRHFHQRPLRGPRPGLAKLPPALRNPPIAATLD